MSLSAIAVQPAWADNVRVMAANLTSGSNQSYDPGDGIRIFQGLKPDIVLLQEFRYKNKTRDDLRALVDEAFGKDFYFAVEPGFIKELPNGIVSRYPIVESGEWKDRNISNRDFAWAKIDIPGDKDLLAVSVHLKAKKSSTQKAEAEDLIEFIADDGIRPKYYLVIGGDFNTKNRSADAIKVLSTVVDTAKPYPVDGNGDPDTNSSRKKPYDAVYVSQDLEALEIPVKIGSQSFTHGLVFDSRVYSPLDEVSPVKRGDSAAPQMQHMAVIRDFNIN